MPKVQISESKSLPFTPAKPDKDSPTGESPGSTRVRHQGGVDSLQLFEVRSAPNLPVDIHAHKEAEIIYIVSGEMIVGNRRLYPGDSLFIDGMTLYGFKAGPEGVGFLNFRARQDLSYFTREQYAEYKQLAPDQQDAMTARLAEERREMVGWD